MMLAATPRFWYLLAAGLLLLALLLRWNALTMPFERDEGEYAYGASLLLHGGVPYQDDFMQKPPMILYTYAAGELISRDVWVPRIFAVGALVAAALTLAALITTEYSLLAGGIAGGLLIVLVSLRLFSGFAAQPEIFLLLPLVLSWRWAFAFWRGAGVRALVLFGAASALAVLYKPIILPACAFLSLAILLKRAEAHGVSPSRRFLYMVLGGATTTLLALGPVLLLGGFPAMLDSAVIYDWYYAPAYAFAMGLGWGLVGAFLPALLLLAWLVAKRKKHAFVWAGLLATALLGTAGSSNPHYYLIAMPAVAALTGIGLTALARTLPGETKLFPYLGAAAIALSLLAGEAGRFILSPIEMSRFIYPGMYFPEAALMGSELAKMSPPGDHVFVDGDEPEIFYYARRRSATRFVILFPLAIDTPLRTRYVAQASTALGAHPPEELVTVGYPGPRHKSDKVDPYRTVVFAGNPYEFVGRVVDHFDGSFAYTLVGPGNTFDAGTTAFTLYRRLPDAHSETARSTSSIEVMPRAAL